MSELCAIEKAIRLNEALVANRVPEDIRPIIEEYAKDLAREMEDATREGILAVAHEAVCSDRNHQYGEPEDSFAAIGALWSAYLSEKFTEIEIDAQSAAEMLILFKIARSVTSETPKADTFADMAGYAACAGEIACGGAV